MSYCFFSLRHNPIISCYYQNNYIRSLSTASPHCRKCSMPWGIQESDRFSIVLNLVSSDMLSDSARLPSRNCCVANRIQQSSFSMVNMSQNGNYRGSSFQLLLVFFFQFFPPDRDFHLVEIIFFFDLKGDGFKIHFR